MSNMFPCTKCGCCCKHLDRTVTQIPMLNNLYNLKLSFPYKWDKTGRCEKLDDNDLCSVYNDRPLFCNVDKFIELNKADIKIGYALNAAECNRLMDEDNIDKKYRVKLKT